MNTQQAIDIEKIVAGFTEQDNEAVYAEVEALDKKVPIHGFTAFISKYLPPDFDPEVLAQAPTQPSTKNWQARQFGIA